MTEAVKFTLDESQLPTHWYNLAADLPAPLPPVLHPGTHQPVGPGDLAPLFRWASSSRRSPPSARSRSPGRSRDVYRLWRRRRSTARAASSRRCGRRRASTTSTRA